MRPENIAHCYGNNHQGPNQRSILLQLQSQRLKVTYGSKFKTRRPMGPTVSYCPVSNSRSGSAERETRTALIAYFFSDKILKLHTVLKSVTTNSSPQKSISISRHSYYIVRPCYRSRNNSFMLCLFFLQVALNVYPSIFNLSKNAM